MTEPESPWARPVPGGPVPEVVPVPPSAPGRVATPPPAIPSTRATGRPVPRSQRAGMVTGRTLAQRQPDVISFGPPPKPPRNRRTLLWFGGAAGAILAGGLAVLLGMVLTGNSPLRRSSAPPDTRSKLAKMCPPPTGMPAGKLPVPPAPPGPRTVDSETGISYRAYGAPWLPWQTVWTGGTLQVSYKVGQHFITENYSGGTYHASILSGSVPAATNDALTLDLKCTGRQVATDVRSEYYPRPNTMEMIHEGMTVLGGRNAYVTTFRLHFNEPGLTARDELVGVALIDVGRPNAAILYVSIPGTHRQFDNVVDDVIQSVRPV